MREYKIIRYGRRNIKELTSVLRNGDETNFHIKGKTQPKGPGRFLVVNETPI